METIDWVLIGFVGSMILIFIVAVVVLAIIKAEIKQDVQKLVDNWEGVKQLKTSKPHDFCEMCFGILSFYSLGWEKFAVLPSIHGKGYMVVGKNNYGNIRFWPSDTIFGEEHKPTYYITEEEAKELLLDVMENLCQREIDIAKEREKLEATIEDKVKI